MRNLDLFLRPFLYSSKGLSVEFYLKRTILASLKKAILAFLLLWVFVNIEMFK